MRQQTSTHDRSSTGRPWLVPVGAGLVLAFLFIPACNDDEPAPPGPIAKSDDRTGTPSNQYESPFKNARQYELSDGVSDEYGPLPDEVGGWRVTKGAAAGYVSDESCKECHESIYESYQEVGMARSLYPLTPENEIEDFGKVFYQETTGDRYVMRKRNGKYYQARWRQDSEGNKYAEYEMEVSWVIGSGNHVRTYLTQSKAGEIWELPLSWYAETGWQMSPSFESKGHKGFERLVMRECLFCHNAYPEVPLGNDTPGGWATFPHELPHGIGCQRCHGPGARHVELAVQEDADDAEVRARIINPANFEQKQREEVCMTCHMQPDVANGINSISHYFDRPTYSHRPDQDLMRHLVYLDCGTAAERHSKIEVNHHAYRLHQSKCYTASPGKLDCLTCHDPHRKVPKKEQADFYRKKCMTCHEFSDCEFEGMGTTVKPHEADCVSCHMVKARPRDVIHVTMTDHLIRRKPPEKDLTAPLPNPKAIAGPLDVMPVFPDRAPKGDLLDVYAEVAKGPRFDRSRGKALAAALKRSAPNTPAAYSKAGRLLDDAGARKPAIEVLRMGLEKFPEDFEIQWNLAWSLHQDGLNDRALELVEQALAQQKHPRVLQLKANILSYLQKPQEAVKAVEAALALRSNQSTAWRQYGHLLMQVGRADDAIVAFRKAIARNPDDAPSYILISDILMGRGAAASAIGILEQAAPLVLDVSLELVALYLFAEPALRRPDRALALAEAAAKKEPENARALLHLAFTRALLNRRPDTAPAAVEKARRLGADPASCTGVEMLLAAAKQDRARVRQLAPQFQKELSQPTPERLRQHVFGVLQGMLRR